MFDIRYVLIVLFAALYIGYCMWLFTLLLKDYEEHRNDGDKKK